MAYAIVFPGQGSQSVGMLAELAESYPQVETTFAEASEALGYDLWQLCQNGPEESLNQTDKTQPAMLAAGVATWRVWQAEEVEAPAVLAGHSLGEFTALVAAGALTFADAIKLVEYRGRLMQEAVPSGTGAMAAILGLSDDEVIKACDDASQGEVVQAVNFNSPGQVVIAGATAAVERAVEAVKAAGAKRALLLPVSVPSHCSLMEPAAAKLAEHLEGVTLQAPTIEVLHNVDVQAHREPAAIKEALIKQLYSPVRWVETVQAFSSRGIGQMVECGPGKVLAGLAKRIDRAMGASAVLDAGTLQKALDSVKS